MKITDKIVIVIFLPVIVSILAAGYIILTIIKSSSISTLRGNQIEVASQTAATFDQFIQERSSDLKYISPEIIDLLSVRPINRGLIVKKLESLIESKHAWQRFDIASSSGSIIASTNPSANPFVAQDVYADINSSRGLKLMTMSTRGGAKQLVFTQALEADDHSGISTNAIIIGYIFPTWMDSILSSSNKNVYLVQENTVVWSSNSVYTNSPLPSNQSYTRLLNGIKDKLSIDLIVPSRESVMKAETLLTSVPSMQSGWGIIVEQPTEIVYQRAYSSLLLLFYFSMALIILLVRLMILILARILTNPLLKLTDTAKQIASGNLSLRIPVKSKDEVGQLSAAFNDMTTRLQVMLKYENEVKETEDNMKKTHTT